MLVVLLWVQALLGIAGGVILVVLHHNRSVIQNTHQSASALLAIGIGVLVIGAITALIAYAIGSGSNFAVGSWHCSVACSSPARAIPRSEYTATPASGQS